MIVESVSRLPNILASDPLVIDVETTSFNDKEQALHPYKGHRVCGIAISTMDAQNSWYLPIRHHHSSSPHENLPIEAVQCWMKDLLSTGRDWINHNIKFDAHFLLHDGVVSNGRMLDTMVLARLVEFDLLEYNLDYLCDRFLKEQKSKSPSLYLASLKPASKDFGRVPINVMGKYAERDATLTAKLYSYLLAHLPAESKALWEKIEVPLTTILFESERVGVQLDTRLMAQTKANCLREMIDLTYAIEKEVKEEIDPMCEDDISRVLIGKYEIEPMAYTKKEKRPQWNQIVLDTLGNQFPVCKLIARYRKIDHFMSTYIDGWLSRADDQGKMHANFKQSGTVTGRLSCSDPNLQNVPVESEAFVQVEDTDAIFACDWSQIEYRFFGHYANDPVILDAYAKNPRMDFHGEFARLLGVERQFAKQLNFSFLYGMGKQALLRNVAGILKLTGERDPKMRATMLRNFVRVTGKEAASERTQNVTIEEENMLIAESIYRQYHEKFPSIRELTRRIKTVLAQRGWIKNFYGRVYRIDPPHAYVGVNYLVQGSAADFLKDRIVAMEQRLGKRLPHKLLANVHDAIYYSVPLSLLADFYLEAKTILEESPLRIPVIVEGKVSSKRWSQVVAIDPHEKNEERVRELITEAYQKSSMVAMRTWGTSAHEDSSDVTALTQKDVVFRQKEKRKGRFGFDSMNPRDSKNDG